MEYHLDELYKNLYRAYLDHFTGPEKGDCYIVPCIDENGQQSIDSILFAFGITRELAGLPMRSAFPRPPLIKPSRA